MVTEEQLIIHQYKSGKMMDSCHLQIENKK